MITSQTKGSHFTRKTKHQQAVTALRRASNSKHSKRNISKTNHKCSTHFTSNLLFRHTRNLLPNKLGQMGLTDSQNGYSLPDAYGTGPTDPARATPEHESGETEQNEETGPGNGNFEAIDEKRIQIFAARMKRAMNGEKQEGETLEFLQRENDKLRAQIVQNSFGSNGGDQSGFDIYAYWLRQQMRLQRMKILHAQIQGHRTQIRHMLEMHGVRSMDLVEATCNRST